MGVPQSLGAAGYRGGGAADGEDEADEAREDEDALGDDATLDSAIPQL